MSSRYRRMVMGVALLAALLPAMPLSLAHAAAPEAHVEVVKIRVEVTDSGFGPAGDFVIQAEQGHKIELTFVWAHVGYVQERHIMVLEGYNLEWDEINFQNREATLQFIADKPGKFIFKCDLDCDIHDYLQGGELRITTGGGGGTVVYTPTNISLSSSSLVSVGDPIFLTATLKDPQGRAVPKAEVRFFQDTSFAGTQGPMDIGTARTDANGVAFLDFQSTIATPQQRITARFEGLGVYSDSEQSIEILQAVVPPPAYAASPIGLERIRGWAPAGLAVVMLLVWSSFGFILYQIFSVARVPRGR